ncbi:MAG: hypothetical protein IKV94_00810 [Clostridia bacterium]|nr:hypothetical protein [Clostridia bacterium]
MSDVQVLVATMNQQDHELINKMNIKTDAIVGNQCDENSIENLTIEDKLITYLNFKEKGVGLNRNNALMRADRPICLIADDDMNYVDGYEDVVKEKFAKHKDADVIIFNIGEENPSRYINKKEFRVRWHNFMRYGAVRIAFRTKAIHFNNIYFNLEFGGGAKYSHGEDTLFLCDCLKKGLKIIAVPEVIANLKEDRESSWFKGYTEKYFYDKGILFYNISKTWSRLLCLQDAIRHKGQYKEAGNWYSVYKKMIKGIKMFKVGMEERG